MAGSTRTYLDYNAGAPLLDCAREAAIEVYSNSGNASSVHFEGRAARKTVEAARVTFAKLVDVNAANVIFTSSATEAANHALSPRIRAGGQTLTATKLYCSAIEHPCVLQGGRFSKENTIPVSVLESGLLDQDHLKTLLDNHDHSAGMPMVAVMLANNETGVIQPVQEIADLVHQYNGIFVVDAVQGLGKMPVLIKEIGADFSIFSGHKIGAPQGCGALVLSSGSLYPEPLLRGGGQENFHRAGTENVAAIAGFSAACNWHLENLTKIVRFNILRDWIEDEIASITLASGNGLGQPVFFGKSENRLANTSCFSVDGVKAEMALVALDLAGVSVSSGSACSSGKVRRSHVLEAMGASETEMEGALRLSFGWHTEKADAEKFLTAWRELVSRVIRN